MGGISLVFTSQRVPLVVMSSCLAYPAKAAGYRLDITFIFFSLLNRLPDPAKEDEVEVELLLEDDEVPLLACFFFFFFLPTRRAFFRILALSLGLGSSAVPPNSVEGPFCPGMSPSSSLDFRLFFAEAATASSFSFFSFFDLSFFFFLLGNLSSPLSASF